MNKRQLPFKCDFLLSYDTVGRVQPVLALKQSMSSLGNIDKDNYMKFRYLQLELIVKQCELLSDIAGYIHSTVEYSQKPDITDKEKMIDRVYESLVDVRGSQIKDFFENVINKDDQFFYRTMGYDLIDKFPIITEDMSKVNNSINILKSIFGDMKSFYTYFWPVYNSYKHGYRLFLNKTHCKTIKSVGVSGELVVDSIIYADPKGKIAPAIFFDRNLANYKLSYFHLLRGIVDAFNIRLLTTFDLRDFDLSHVNSPYIKLFRNIRGDHIDVSVNIWNELLK
jgi:hypothetical protein